jgi:hypothetical protein
MKVALCIWSTRQSTLAAGEPPAGEAARAWADFADLDAIFAPCGVETPDLIYAAVIGSEIAKWLAEVSYAQPANNSTTLTGICARPGTGTHKPATSTTPRRT